jgi:hypothetical protein
LSEDWQDIGFVGEGGYLGGVEKDFSPISSLVLSRFQLTVNENIDTRKEENNTESVKHIVQD